MNATELRTAVFGLRERRRSPVRMTPVYVRLRAHAVRSRDTLADAIGDRVRSTRRSARRGRYALEDGTNRATFVVRRAPLRSVSLSFAAGAAAGALINMLVVRARVRQAAHSSG
jgi:hypothetical protein